jgi:hypothetical protein
MPSVMLDENQTPCHADKKVDLLCLFWVGRLSVTYQVKGLTGRFTPKAAMACQR